MRSHQQSMCVAIVLAATAVGYAPAALGQVQTGHFQSDVTSTAKPWTHLDFHDDPMDFQFAIISDRAGGVRPGVFADGVKKLNLLMPEFVMSVGDFIPGNTQDRQQLAQEWKEFDEVLRRLKVPFFFVPGNHDINNDVMRDVWLERSGVPFYSFTYKNVLFLALDSTGEKGIIVPDHQIEYMKTALEEHADVRWTFVFLHHPLWLYDEPTGFAQIEELLKGRSHTVIAGHTHRYLHERRGDANYYILATTGGGSKLRGTRFGEFDHVTLVTVTNEGPVMANLRLEGILPHDVTTRADFELTQALLRATDIRYMMLTDRESFVQAGTLYLTFRNPSHDELQIKAQFMHSHEIRIVPHQIDMTLAGGSQKVIQVALESSEALPADNPALLRLDWTMGYEFDDQEDLVLSGTRTIPFRPSSRHLIATVAPEYVASVDVALSRPDPGLVLHYTTDGSLPTTASPAYEKPFTVNDTVTVKARMFNEKGHGTATSTQSYKPVPAGSGLRYRFYAGSWTRMPDYSKLEPVFESVATDLNVESRQLWEDNWGMVLEGNLRIDRSGQYTFHLNSDDGSILYIDDKRVIDNDGDHSLLELSGAAQLSAGTHRLRIDFFEAGGEAVLELDVEGPGMQRQPLPFERVSH